MANIKNSIRQFVEEQLIIEEAKDHLIRKIPNLTQDEKEKLIEIYQTNPSLETKVKIDWNRLNDLTWDSFKDVINYQPTSSSSLRKAVKNEGISGLTKGKDYITLDKVDQVSGLQGAYMPLTYDASKLIASKSIGDCEGKWCTAAQRTSKDWNKYIFNDGIALIYIVYEGEKYALAVYGDIKLWELFDMDNEPIRALPGLDVDELIQDNEAQIEDIRLHFSKKENSPIDIEGGFGGTKYTQHPDGSVDVFGDVKLSGRKLESLPLKYNKVQGNFDVSNNLLESLEGSPIEVDGDFTCNDNPTLKSLSGGPKKVKGSFSAAFTALEDLIGGPVSVGGGYDVSRSGIDSLIGAPKEVGGVFRATGNDLTSLEGSPYIVDGNFMVQQNKLISLSGAPNKVGGKFVCSRNITTFTVDEVANICVVKGEISV